MRDINLAIIHCADTYKRMDIGVKEIDQWHRERGFDSCGYHFVIRRDGKLEQGRPMEQTGAHAAGYNYESLGICLVGGRSDDDEPEFNYTADQMMKLRALVAILKDLYPGIEVIGHRDVSGKACPSFDAKAYFAES